MVISGISDYCRHSSLDDLIIEKRKCEYSEFRLRGTFTHTNSLDDSGKFLAPLSSQAVHSLVCFSSACKTFLLKISENHIYNYYTQ
jgi:hypothetical protein